MNDSQNQVHVAVAVIINDQQQVLLALRQSHQHQGGLWEFPGGKVEDNETVYDALCREIYEELALTIQSAEPLLKTVYQYSDKAVLLDVWLVGDFIGEAQGQEGQRLQWIAITNLNADDFPAANVPIINVLKLRVKT